MRHLTDRQISDYVRGVCARPERAEIRQHLSACPACTEAILFFAKLQESAVSALTPVPEEVVAKTKTLFRAQEQQGKPQKSPLRQVFPRLVFPRDSEWALAGVRSTLSSGAFKQAVYQWGDFFVDLRSESHSDTERLSLMGQVSNHRASLERPEEIQIRVLAGAKTFEMTRCNGLGEFTLAYVPARSLCLEIIVPDAEIRMKVMLKDLTPKDAIQ